MDLKPIKLAQNQFGVGWMDQTNYVHMSNSFGYYKTEKGARTAIEKHQKKYPKG
jgi:hypothetical protein